MRLTLLFLMVLIAKPFVKQRTRENKEEQKNREKIKADVRVYGWLAVWMVGHETNRISRARKRRTEYVT